MQDIYADMPDVMNPTQAGKYLNLAPQGVREHMRRGILDLGLVIPPAKKGGRYSFKIYKAKLLKVLGKEG